MRKLIIAITLTISPILAQCDWNEDMSIDVLDVVSTVNCIMNNCWDGTQCDWNDDDDINVLDVVATVNCIINDCAVYGCTDIYALNYNPEANIDDGSCNYQGTVTDIDGNVYNTIVINDQEWMAENLKVTHYRNGDEIPVILDGDEWNDLSEGAFCYYDNNPGAVDIFGNLYNYYAVDDPRGIAPEGWHVASDAEYQQLSNAFGGNYIAGGHLKTTGTYQMGSGLWGEPNEGATNYSGFSGQPGGTTSQNWDYQSLISRAYFWTSYRIEANGKARILEYNLTSFSSTSNNMKSGNSVRCVKDVITEIHGCTDSDAINFNIEAVIDDGSCFEWVFVPEGEFTFGEGDSLNNIDYDYEFLKYEITNAQFIVFRQQLWDNDELAFNFQYLQGYYEGDEYHEPGFYGYIALGTPGWNESARISLEGGEFLIRVPDGYSTGDFDDHPVAFVSWFGAHAFAEYYGLRLPTEEEWEKAARGNTGWDYPWGDNLDGSYANYPDSDNSWGSTTPVGYYNGSNYDGFQTSNGSSIFGAYDLAGNVYEWTSSYLTYPTQRIARGGGWNNTSPTFGLPSWFRWSGSPGVSGSYVGFRCVRDID